MDVLTEEQTIVKFEIMIYNLISCRPRNFSTKYIFCWLILIPLQITYTFPFRLRAFFHGYSSKDSLDRCIDNVCMFPTEENLYLLTDAAMALKVDPNTLDTTDEVGNLTYVLYYFIPPHHYASHVILALFS